MRRLALVFALVFSPLHAHELWIAPDAYQVPADTIMTGHIVNGEDFEGRTLAYIPQRFQRFVAVNGGKFTNIDGRVGDSPALHLSPLGEGLHVVAYISTVQTVDYENWAKFQKFVDHKDLGNVLGHHTDRELPVENFAEAYTRFSKSLLGAGNAQGEDRRLGLETEIVALTNPYIDDASDGMKLQLFYKRDVRADEQIEVFEKAPDGTVSVEFYRTDEDGIATVQVKPGHEYMADAVVLREPTEALFNETGAVWETLWANMTWAMPE
jgi:hypothetical protein